MTKDLLKYCIEPERDVYTRIIQKNGHKHQIKKAIEEMGELVTELAGYLAGEHDHAAVRSEIADVENTLIQMRILFDRQNLVPDIMAEKMRIALNGE